MYDCATGVAMNVWQWCCHGEPDGDCDICAADDAPYDLADRAYQAHKDGESFYWPPRLTRG